MGKYEDIIAQVQKVIYCPACGRKYDASEIKLRGYFDKTYILQTICSKGHAPLLTIFVTSYQKNDKIQKIEKIKITTDDVILAHKQIEAFDGDFIKIWNEKK